MQSDSIGALAAALSKAQADITGALKDSSNPFFKSKYADLASCWDACRKQLAANGLSVIQTTQMTEQGLMLVTTLAHASGEWIAGQMPVLTKDNSPQGQGSGITYARRYALAAIVGLAQIDDDAEAAQGRFTNDPRGDLGKKVDQTKRDQTQKDKNQDAQQQRGQKQNPPYPCGHLGSCISDGQAEGRNQIQSCQLLAMYVDQTILSTAMTIPTVRAPPKATMGGGPAKAALS